MRHFLFPTVLFLLAFVSLVGSSSAAISRDGSCTAAAASCTLSGVATGDLKVTVAFRSNSATPPSIPANWIQFDFKATGTTSMVAGCEIASSGSDTGTGTWTNATHVFAFAYAGANTGQNCFFAIGSLLSHAGATANTTASFNALTMTNSTNVSWVAAVLMDDSGSLCTPAGMTAISSATDIRGMDTNGTVSSWSTTTCAVASSTWDTEVFEILPSGQLPVIDQSVWQSWSDSGACGNPTPPGPGCSSIQKGGAGNPPPLDEVLVANIVWGDATQTITSSVADSCGNTVVSADGPVNLGTDARAQTFLIFNTQCAVGSGQDLVTATLSATSNGPFFDGMLITIYALQNVASSPLDSAVTAHAIGSTATMSVTTGTPILSNEMIMGQGICDSACSPMAGSGYASIIGDAVAIAEFKDITTGVAQTVTANPNGGSWLIMAQGLKAFANSVVNVNHAPPMIY
jgi:hypothetical protein